MNYKRIKEAVFIERPNRFLAKVVIEGEHHTAHVKNTGRCKELLYDGVKVYLEDHGDMPTRKTRYSLVTVEKSDLQADKGMRFVNIDSQAPNRVVAEALSNGNILLPGFSRTFSQVRPETTFGDSRFDFYVEDNTGNKAYIEVKGVTLEDLGIASFPDAPTERGVKHIKELCRALESGFSAFLIFVIQMKGVIVFEPNDETHPAFGDALREAQKRGVIVLAYDCGVTPDSITISSSIEVKL